MNNYSILPPDSFLWFSPSDWAPSKFTTVNYQYTGIELSKEISDNEWVLDIGCGINPFKNLVKNLVGIDPIMYQDSLVDVITTIEDFDTTQKFDVFFCLGSLNPISKPMLYYQLKKIKSLANDKYRIYVRAFSWEHGIWSNKLIDEICKDFSLKCTVFVEDKNINTSMNKNKNSVKKKYFIKLEST